MKTAASISALLLLLATTSGAGGEPPTNDRDPWNGFGVGSWAIQTESICRVLRMSVRGFALNCFELEYRHVAR